MAIKLSICIPTYNRAAFLKECLESILISIQSFESMVEIVISDNASTDDTTKVVSEFQKNCPLIRYHRKAKGILGELNFYSVATLATGDYVWVFGDDDKMTREAVSAIISKIQLGYDLIICNYAVWSKDFSEKLKEMGLPFKEDSVFTNPNELMKCFGLHLGYISSIIIKRKLFFKLTYSEYEAYAEYGFPFVYSVYTGMIASCQAIYIATPLLCNRSGNYGAFDWNKYFITGTSLIFAELQKKGYSPKAILRAKHQVLKDFIIKGIVYKKRFGKKVKGTFLCLLPGYKKNWYLWCVCVPVLCMPGILVQLARNFVLGIRKARNFFKITVVRGE